MNDAKVALSRLNIRSGYADEALRLSTSALAANPNSVGASLVSAQALLAKGDIERASAQVEEALKREPESLAGLAMFVSVSARRNRPGEAVQRISALARKDPRNAGVQMLLGMAYFNAGDLAQSEASVRQAITLDARTPNGYTMLANIASVRGDTEKTKMYFRKAIEVNPRFVLNYMALENLYEKEGNLEEARKLCERAREVAPDDPLVANQLAYLYLEHGGDANVALSLAQQAKQRLPDSPDVADTLGWANYKVGSPQSAVAQLKESTRKAPGNALFQYHLGMAYLALKEYDLAERSLKLALNADPKFPQAADVRAALERLPKAR